MSVQAITEGAITWLPGLRLTDLPSPLPAGLRLLSRGDELGIEAQGVVGALPLRNGDTLQILPKIGQANFLRMLFRGLGRDSDFERHFKGTAEYGVSGEENIAALAARQLVRATAEILARGVASKRVRTLRRHAAASGQVLPTETALALARREESPVVTRVSVRSHDSSENRLIGRALLAAAPFLQAPDRRLALDIHDRWHRRSGAGPLRPDDLQVVEERIARHWYGGPRAYYLGAATLALILLGAQGLSIDSRTVVQGEPVLLNSADVFEKYIRHMILEEYGKRGYIVTKAGSTTFSLYQDGSYEIEPDVVVQRASAIVLVGDAKYKVPVPDDHYQMLAYLTTMGVSLGVLVTPADGATEVTMRRYTTAEGITTVVAYLPMQDLGATEAFLREIVERTHDG